MFAWWGGRQGGQWGERSGRAGGRRQLGGRLGCYLCTSEEVLLTSSGSHPHVGNTIESRRRSRSIATAILSISLNANSRMRFSFLCNFFLGFLASCHALRAKHPSGSASPVDGFQIRNSLYVTQPLRSPARASVRVMLNEDMSKMVLAAKYHGIADQAQRAERDFENELLALGADSKSEKV